MKKEVDKIFLWIVVFLALGGFFLFISASMGLFARETGARFMATAFNQFFYGLFLGSIFLTILSKVNYKIWRKYSFYIFIFSLLLTASVFIPGIGFSHGGAIRWLSFGIFSFQPAEILKFGVIIYLAALFSDAKSGVRTIKWGIAPLVAVLFLSGTVLLLQPDSGTFFVIFITSISIFIIAGSRWSHLISMFAAACFGFLLYIASKPYILERLKTFFDPTYDIMGAGWQLNQSLIAIGSGNIFGKGFGQSIQKFNFLPEPTSDSIFAVASEEFGFIGGIIIIFFFIFFLLRGLSIARKSSDMFGRLVVSGIVIMTVFQAFINIASMMGVFPLTGIPLPFISHGGTALMITLAEMGIVLNISRYARI